MDSDAEDEEPTEPTEIDPESLPPVEDGPATPIHSQFQDGDFWEDSQVDGLNPVGVPISPTQEPLEDAFELLEKKVEMEDPSSKCVVVEDSPMKAASDISLEIARLQKKQADAKRESMARNFGYKYWYILYFQSSVLIAFLFGVVLDVLPFQLGQNRGFTFSYPSPPPRLIVLHSLVCHITSPQESPESCGRGKANGGCLCSRKFAFWD